MPGAYGWREEKPHVGVDRVHMARYYLARGFVEPDDVVVDAACGWGAGSALLARACRAVIGVDVDEKYIAANPRRHPVPNVSWALADLEAPDLELPECDVAVTIETIEHLADPEPFVRELLDKTRRFVVYTVDTLPSVAIAEAKGKGTTHKRDYTPKEVQRLMSGPGWAQLCGFQFGHPRFGVLYREEGT